MYDSISQVVDDMNLYSFGSDLELPLSLVRSWWRIEMVYADADSVSELPIRFCLVSCERNHGVVG